jgi:hypothetical protein
MSGLRATLRRSWRVLLSYGLFSVWGVSCLVASLALTSSGFGVSPGDLGVVLGVLAATVVGHVAGNLLGLAGLRLLPVMLLFLVLFLGATLSGLAIGALALFLLVAATAALGGYLGIASRLDVVASWYPLSFCVGGAVIWMNRHGAASTIHGGEKHAVWDGFTMLCLAGGVFLMLIFLATRHALGLTVWQEVARPRAGSAGAPDEGVAVARPGRGSIVVLLGFTLVVLGATALVSPYLFRTHHDDKTQTEEHASSDRGKSGGGKSGQGGEPHASSGHGQPKGGSGRPLDDPDASGASDAASEALALGMRLFLWLLAAAAALLFLMLAVFPPIRRALLLRHLERPLWPVAPTARVMNLWRRALAALAVIDVVPGVGEAPSDFARRAEDEVRAQLHCEAVGLAEAAAIVERIDYAGRGLGAGEEQRVKGAITAFVRTVEQRIDARRRLAAAWGRAPEVEP